MLNQLIKFEVGKSYWVRSTCDYNCIWNFTITGRSKSGKSVTFKKMGDDFNHEKRCKIKIYKSFTYGDCEYIKPMGDFSMSPILTADDVIKE